MKKDKEKKSELNVSDKNFNKLNNNKRKNYSCPNIKMNKKNKKNNKSNITMNNNYIFNNIQNKYNLTKLNNLYSKTFNNNNNDFINPKEEIPEKINNNKIIKVISIYYKRQNNHNMNINLNNKKETNSQTILFLIKIINVYKNILLEQKKTEKLLYKEIIEKNNEIKKLKLTYLKILYFLEKERNNIDNLKEKNYKKQLITKQLIEENNYLRNLIMYKDKMNIFSNFYSSYDSSYEGLLGFMEKGIVINNQLKTKNINSNNETVNNSPQLSKRDNTNNDYLSMNRKRKIIQNFYILKKNRKEI